MSYNPSVRWPQILAAAAITGIATSLIYPVVAQQASAGRTDDEATCFSNAQALGMALTQYLTDYDDRFPPSFAGSAHGWAGRFLPYLIEPGTMHCPKDSTAVSGSDLIAVSYGLNGDLAQVPAGSSAKSVGGAFADDLNSPAKTVAFFEIAGDPVDTASLDEGTGGWKHAPASGYLSAVGIGIASRMWARWDDSAGTAAYATGSLGGRPGFGPVRHSHGSVFIAADGHAAQLQPAAVSGGRSAKSGSSDQDVAAGKAAGSGSAKYKLTFSPQ